MSLKTKIILSFLISSIIIAILAASAYINFVEIRKEIQYLELSDTVRSKSLQLRRHEKNFFLYGDLKEIENVHTYLKDLNTILQQSSNFDGTLLSLKNKVEAYSQRFNHIEILFWEFQKEFAKLKASHPQYAVFSKLIESTILERPAVNAEVLEKVFSAKHESRVVGILGGLDEEITLLRKTGEEILTISKDLDKSAREKTERAIGLSQAAALILFPLFFVIGLGTLFAISHNIVKRLKILTGAIKNTGKGAFLSLPTPSEDDEVGALIHAFNRMELDLIARDGELKKKNEELLQSRKLASIGTLASGVAHELNNPLNNIYLAAQILSREIDQETFTGVIKDTVRDIFSQTLRVKRIVNDLLEFSREKAPELKMVNISGVINNVLSQMAVSGELGEVKCSVKAAEDISLPADSHLLQQVFINLFSNAVEAMEGKGSLDIAVEASDKSVRIAVSDTGKGILPRDIPRIFDPFFTTKEKGTGLGLAIVYSIINKHNGKIEVNSTPYKGTTFTIILPR